MGWPETEQLIVLAAKHKNLYLSLSGIVGWCARAPYRGYQIIGQALEWCGPDKIVMGHDLPFDEMKRITDYMRTFEIPEEVQQQWGFPAVDQETRAKILGLNLAKLTGVKPKKRV